MGFIVVIPSRFGSTRLPGKPLLDIAGKPMVQHVWESACKSSAEAVYIATDNENIFNTATAFGANVCMTREDHVSGTDRLQEVVTLLGLADEKIVVNVQGDEPLIPAVIIDQVAALLDQPQAQMASLYEAIINVDDVFNPNAVKVVTSQHESHEKALYFSRAPIPWARDEFTTESKSLPNARLYKRHIGIYAYRAGLLNTFVSWPAAQLELLEKLEQLRVLENGIDIHMARACEEIPAGVDTPEDLEKVRRLMS